MKRQRVLVEARVKEEIKNKIDQYCLYFGESRSRIIEGLLMLAIRNLESEANNETV